MAGERHGLRRYFNVCDSVYESCSDVTYITYHFVFLIYIQKFISRGFVIGMVVLHLYVVVVVSFPICGKILLRRSSILMFVFYFLVVMMISSKTIYI